MFAREVAGPDRVLYAMDYPFQVSRDEVEVHESLPLGAQQKRFLFEQGAVSVFGLQEAGLPAVPGG